MLLRRCPGVGDVTFRALIERFGTPQAVWAAPPESLAQVEGLSAAARAGLRPGPSRKFRGAAEAELDRLEAAEVQVLTLTDRDYPAALRATYDPPALLFVSGAFRPEDRCAVALVGSRHATEYGLRQARRLSGQLAARGLTVVSGLARGIDAAAHQGALEAGGRTLAVIGCGLDGVYPPEHAGLQERIARECAVVSELPLGSPPDAIHFPRRNRIISGLVLGVVVVEAGERSGALITARLALEQGREVYAVPGMIDSTTAVGTHGLIKQGAKLVEDVDDILAEVQAQLGPAPLPGPAGVAAPAPPALVGVPPAASEVFDVLSQEPKHIDEITAATRLASSQVAVVLLHLELNGAIRRLNGQRFVRI